MIFSSTQEIEKFIQRWASYEHVYLWGISDMLKSTFSEISEKFNIAGIFDADPSKQNTFFNGYKVQSPDNIDNSMKIVIFPGLARLLCKRLQEMGMKENIDYCIGTELVSALYFCDKREIMIPLLNINVTSKCTLKCKQCILFMPYYKDARNRNIDRIKADIDIIFGLGVRVFLMSIIGGEPFLNDELSDIIEYICKNYSNKINEIVIVTNGTVMPTQREIQTIKKFKIGIYISDYSDTVKYKDKLEKFTLFLNNEGVQIKKIHYQDSSTINQWDDMSYYPSEELSIFTEDDAANHYDRCNYICTTLSDGKLYVCDRVYHANEVGIVQEATDDIINLQTLDKCNEEDRLKILKYLLHHNEKGYFNLCKHCRGRDPLLKKYVAVAEQLV